MISVKPWSAKSVVRLFLGVFATLCVGVLVTGGVEKLKLGHSEDDRQFLEMITMIVFFQGAALVWVAFFLRQANTSWTEAFGLDRSPVLSAMAFGFAVGIAVLPTAVMLETVSGDVMQWLHIEAVEQAAVQALQNPALSLVQKIFFGIFAIVLAPLAEEILFRGILYPTIKQRGYPRLAVWGTSLVFGAMHLSVVTLVPLVFFAVVLVYLYESSGSLLAPIAAHATFNLANFFLLIYSDQVMNFLHRIFHIS